MRARRTALLRVVPLTIVLAVALGGCASGSGGSADASVVTAHPGPADQLDFFDALEARPRVSYDDAIHAALLLEQEDSQTDYARRVAVARQNGLLPGEFDRPADKPISTGDAADLVMRAMVSRAGGTRGGESTPEGATAQFQSAGVLADSARPGEPISGRDFVSLVVGAREMIGLAPAREPTVFAETPPTPAPTPDGEGESFDEPVAVAAEPASGATRELSALPQPKPADEPLVPPATSAPQPPKPAAAAPVKAEPSAPTVEPATDRRWVPGRPVKPPAPAAPKRAG